MRARYPPRSQMHRASVPINPFAGWITNGGARRRVKGGLAAPSGLRAGLEGIRRQEAETPAIHQNHRRKEKPMRKALKHALLALGAALIVGGTAGKAAAQPANCGDVNGDGQVNSLDSSALAAGQISAACAATNCADVNAVGGVELGDQIVLSRFVIGGGTTPNPVTGRPKGEENLLFKLCTSAPAPVPCNTPATAVTGRFTSNQTWPGPADGCNEFFIRGRVTMANNSTLTIRPGAVIRAVVNANDPALILIARGSR